MRRGCAIAVGLALVAGLVVVAAFVVSEYLATQPTQESCTAVVGDLTAELSVEQAENTALISGVSVRRGLPPRAATIALATAFQESDIVNIEYGDRDSLGLFQQRPSQGWGTPREIMDPYYSTNTFYEHLAKVDGYTSMPIAEAAQAVQRSADGSAYAPHEPRSRALASALTGESRAAFSCVLLDSPATRDSAGLRSELTSAFGRVDAERSAGTVRVQVDAAEQERGWAVAQWAVAYAQRYGVTAVLHDGKVWRVEESETGWQNAQSAPGDRVRIEFAPPE